MIEFIEQGHIYLLDGVITPSVSKILKFIFPDKYEGIPKWIMESKADFGTNVHKAIENEFNGLETPLEPFEQMAYEQYIKLKEKHAIEPLNVEEMISYKTSYCGRLDMIANINGVKSLVDIKTTAKLDYEYLEWQLGMYMLGLNEQIDCYCLWLPKKDLGELVKITPKSKKEIDEVLNDYEKLNTD